MKKLALTILGAAILTIGASSCAKKCATCKVGSSSTELCKENTTTAGYDAFKTACTSAGGTVTEK